MAGLLRRSPTRARFRHFNGDGLLLWANGYENINSEGIKRGSDELIDLMREQEWRYNSLTNEGEDWVVDVAFRNNQVLNLMLGLGTDATYAETDAYAQLQEVAGTGYAAKSITRSTANWTAPSSGSITTPASGVHTFTASGTWSAAEAAIIYTTGGTPNRFIAWNDLSATRTLISGDSLDVDFDIVAS